MPSNKAKPPVRGLLLLAVSRFRRNAVCSVILYSRLLDFRVPDNLKNLILWLFNLKRKGGATKWLIGFVLHVDSLFALLVGVLIGNFSSLGRGIGAVSNGFTAFDNIELSGQFGVTQGTFFNHFDSPFGLVV